MNQKVTEIDVSEYETELASLRRVAIQLKEFRKWLLNVSMASLAFAFTFMYQAKGEHGISYTYLAALSLGSLMISTVLGFLIRAKSELDNFTIDSRGFSSIFPLLKKSINDSSEITDKERKDYLKYFDLVDTLNKNGENLVPSKFTPYKELALIALNFMFLAFGVGSLSIYLCIVLFSIN